MFIKRINFNFMYSILNDIFDLMFIIMKLIFFVIFLGMRCIV